jgi:TPR repeat protein
MVSCTKEARMRIGVNWTKDPKGQYEYGCYLIANRPRDFHRDFEEGRKYIEMAANAGSPVAMNHLAALYALGRDPNQLPTAVSWYVRAAEAGYRPAMLELESAYRYGDLGLAVDKAKADSWHARLVAQGMKEEDERWAPLKKRAEAGEVKAMEELAQVYEARGEFFWPLAVDWNTRAAKAGSLVGSMRLVQAYREEQLGLPRDEVKADQWFRIWQANSARQSAAHP